MDFVALHNSDESHSYKVALNFFADMSNEEFQAIYIDNQLTQKRTQTKAIFDPRSVLQNLTLIEDTTTVDWVSKGVVTQIKNQGKCLASWAFAATGSMESAIALRTGKLTSLSEQNLMDCSQEEGNEGCDGGLMDDAYLYVIQNGGIMSEQAYPYLAVQSFCKFNQSRVAAVILDFTNLPEGSENALRSAVYQQPVSIAIDGSLKSFQLYSSGIYYDGNCSSIHVNAGMLAVGYGILSNTSANYWFLKNSWGTSWGMKGYAYLARNKGNACGVATMGSFPSV